MKQDEWTQRLRDHLADFEAPVPDELWEKIEAHLPDEIVAEETKSRTIPLWVRWTAVAAFVGVLIGTTALLWSSHEESKTTPMASAVKEKDKDGKETQVKMGSPVLAEAVEAVAAPQTLRDTISIYNKEVEPEIAESQPQWLPVEPTPTEEHSKIVPSQQTQIRELDQKIAKCKEHRGRGTTFSLYASNGFGDLSNRNGVLMSPQMQANYDYDNRMGVSSTRSGGPVYLANYEERQKYYQPISFGLTVNFPISSRFSLSSGVVYTRLSSDFTNRTNSLEYQKHQTLHYVGIPLNVQYHVWKWRSLNVYATAGGQADMNVKAHLESDGLEQDVKKDRIQWSVNGAMGVQYNLIPQLGLYVEPGIRYYFDNGSHVRNYFKYRHTNFNLQIGLRVNIEKP